MAQDDNMQKKRSGQITDKLLISYSINKDGSMQRIGVYSLKNGEIYITGGNLLDLQRELEELKEKYMDRINRIVEEINTVQNIAKYFMLDDLKSPQESHDDDGYPDDAPIGYMPIESPAVGPMGSPVSCGPARKKKNKIK